MQTRKIIATHKLGQFTVDVTQSSDSFNGLIYRGKELIGCVAIGLHEEQEVLIQKALKKINDRTQTPTS